MDPAMEHSVVIMGRPLQPFPQQNHEQHIKSHRTFMSSKMISNNPMIVMSLISHINQHVSLLATQVVDKALVEEAEKLRQQFGEQIPQEEVAQLQMKRDSLINEQILKITETMVNEGNEAMEDMQMDPLVLLKQQELQLRQAEMEMNNSLKTQNQGLKEDQFEYKQELDDKKIKQSYDIADLRADVALQRANATKQEG
jgi:thiol:disulfide interchange protein